MFAVRSQTGRRALLASERPVGSTVSAVPWRCNRLNQYPKDLRLKAGSEKQQASKQNVHAHVQGWADKSGQNCEAYNRACDLNKKLKLCRRHV